MKTARFNPDGGPIEVRVVCGFAQPGSYEVFLWEADRNSRERIGIGNFINSDDDSYSLPVSPGTDGKIVQCITTVNPIAMGDRFGAGLVLTQDEKEIGREFIEGTSDLPTVTIAIYVQLQG